VFFYALSTGPPFPTDALSSSGSSTLAEAALVSFYKTKRQKKTQKTGVISTPPKEKEKPRSLFTFSLRLFLCRLASARRNVAALSLDVCI
jgi:hypothetical protein